MRLKSVLKKIQFCLDTGDGFSNKIVLLFGATIHTLKVIAPFLFGNLIDDQKATAYNIIYKHKSLKLYLRHQDFQIFYEIFLEENYRIPNEWHNDIKVIVDLGGHIGLTSIYYHIVLGGKCKIYCIEPSPDNFAILEKNINILSGITAINMAIWEKEEPLFLSNEEYGHNHQVSRKSGDSMITPGITLEKLLTRYDIPKVDLLKIDIEGAELQLFSTFNNWKNKVNKFVIELHDNCTIGWLKNSTRVANLEIITPADDIRLKMPYGLLNGDAFAQNN